MNKPGNPKEKWAYITHWLKMLFIWTVVAHLALGAAVALGVVVINRVPGLFHSATPRFFPAGEAAKVIRRLAPRWGLARYRPRDTHGASSLAHRLTERELSRLLSAWADETLEGVLQVRTAVRPLWQHRPTGLPGHIGWLAPFDKRATRRALALAFVQAGVGGSHVHCPALKQSANQLSHTAQEDAGATYAWWWHNGTGKEVAAVVLEEANRLCRLMKKHLAQDRLARLAAQTGPATCPRALAQWRRDHPQALDVLQDPFAPGASFRCAGDHLLYGVGPNLKDNHGHPRKDQVVVIARQK